MSELATYLPGILAAYAILVVGASSPGPAVAMILGIATTQGRGPSLVASLGIATGSMTLNLLTLVGVSVLLTQVAWAMLAVKLVGAAYLLWLAYGALRRAVTPPPVIAAADVPRISAIRWFAAGYALQVTNPKAIVFWIAIAAVGAVTGAPLPVVLFFLAGGWVISFTSHALWSLLLSSRRIRAAYAAGRRWVDVTLGAFFAFAAFKLATSET